MMLAAALAVASFAGSWLFTYGGQPILTMTVDDRGNGSLTRPRDLAINQDGEVTRIGRDQKTIPVRGAGLDGSTLKLTIDGDAFTMTLDGDRAAWLATEGMRPWRLERIAKPVKLATSLRQRSFPAAIQQLRARLAEMVKQDQDARLHFDSKRMTEIDEANRAEVIRIYDRYGWITKSLAGSDAAHNFWLLVQHQDLEIQQRTLPALEKAAKSGDASMSDYAYLYDRVQVGLGKLQHWGTQTKCIHGKPELFPVDDPQKLEERRRELSMPPVQAYLSSDYLQKFCSTGQ